MRTTYIHGPFDIQVHTEPDPSILAPHDAIISTVAACVCGSDLWGYRGISPVEEPTSIGHEVVGIVEAVGADVRSVRPGQFVIAPFMFSDGTCMHCTNNVHTSCVNGGFYSVASNGCQSDFVRIPYADGTLVGTPERPDPTMVPSLLTLSDVMGTGWHAAVSAGVRKGSTVAVIGDGAVGLCAVLAAKELGADRIIAMSRHAPRQTIARQFGATDVVATRGKEGVSDVKDLTGGMGVDIALECVGLEESMNQAFGAARPGGMVGYVGVPHGASADVPRMFSKNVGLVGGLAPVRAYLPELLDRVLAGRINPGLVFDSEVSLTDVALGYQQMHERTAIKALVRP